MFHFPSSNQNNSLEKQKKFPDFVFLIFNSCNYILALLGHINDPRKRSSSTFPGLKLQQSRTKFPCRRSYDPGSRTLNYLPLSFHFFLFSFFFVRPTDRPTFTRDRAIGNETFHGYGLTISKSHSDISITPVKCLQALFEVTKSR